MIPMSMPPMSPAPVEEPIRKKKEAVYEEAVYKETKPDSFAASIAASEMPKSLMPTPITSVAPIQSGGGRGFLMPQFQIDPNGSAEAQNVVARGLNGESAVRGIFLY